MYIYIYIYGRVHAGSAINGKFHSVEPSHAGWGGGVGNVRDARRF